MRGSPHRLYRSGLPQPRWRSRFEERVPHCRRQLDTAPFSVASMTDFIQWEKSPGWSPDVLDFPALGDLSMLVNGGLVTGGLVTGEVISDHLVTGVLWSLVRFGHRRSHRWSSDDLLVIGVVLITGKLLSPMIFGHQRSLATGGVTGDLLVTSEVLVNGKIWSPAIFAHRGSFADIPQTVTLLEVGESSALVSSPRPTLQPTNPSFLHFKPRLFTIIRRVILIQICPENLILVKSLSPPVSGSSMS